MSGVRGEARKGKLKVRTRISFLDTGKTVSSSIFMKKEDITEDAAHTRLENKYGKSLTLNKITAISRY